MSRIVVGMTMRTTSPSRQPTAMRDENDDRDRRKGQVKEKLVRFLGRRGAIVARDADFEVGRDDAAFDGVQASHHVFRHHDGVGALSLGDGDRHRGTPLQLAIGETGHSPGAMLRLGGPDRHVSHILDIDGPSVARRQQQEPDVGHALERLPGEDWRDLPPSRKAPTRKERLALVSLSMSWLSVTP